MNTHLMLDFETLGQASDTVVLSLGATLFNREGIIESMEWVFKMDDQMRARRSINADTIVWWLGQSEKAKTLFARTQKEGIGMRQFMDEFPKWIGQRPGLKVWSNGASFDVPIMDSLMSMCQVKPPWKFWDVRCYRTMKAIHEIEKNVPRQGTHHSAMDDSAYQAQCVIKWLQQFPQWDK